MTMLEWRQRIEGFNKLKEFTNIVTDILPTLISMEVNCDGYLDNFTEFVRCFGRILIGGDLPSPNRPWEVTEEASLITLIHIYRGVRFAH